MPSIDGFKNALQGGGARSNQFEVQLSFPDGTDASQSKFLCTAASLPASKNGQVNVPYRGREVKLVGDKTFENWTVTVLNDTDFAMRRAFERWHATMNSFDASVGSFAPVDYFQDLVVYQLDRSGNRVYGYQFIGAWPISIQEISLEFNADVTDVEKFQVEFAFQYFRSSEIGGVVLR